VPYVIEGGFGVYAKNNPRKIASTVFSLFEDDGLMKSMSSNAKVLSRPEATREIAKDVGALALRSKHESIPKFKDTV
jgi:UDP-N-acetylglucosamine:LPS N-acetylglucosamine transferase